VVKDAPAGQRMRRPARAVKMVKNAKVTIHATLAILATLTILLDEGRGLASRRRAEGPRDEKSGRPPAGAKAGGVGRSGSGAPSGRLRLGCVSCRVLPRFPEWKPRTADTSYLLDEMAFKRSRVRLPSAPLNFAALAF